MKQTTIIAMIFLPALWQGNAMAQQPQKLNIDQATVFISGAELTSSARVMLSKGENEITFSNVAGDVNNQSIIVNASNGVVVESSTFQNNYLATDNVSPRLKEIKDSIEYVTARRQDIYDRLAVINEKITILQSNRKVGGDNTGLSVAELQKMLDLVGTKMEAYLSQKSKESETLKKTDQQLTRLNQQLNEEQQKGYQPGGQLVIKFYAKEATTSNINITYIVPHAGWTPTYDVRAEDAHSPVKLFYKANIYQNSGVKWDNVRLSLSTGNPVEGMQSPELRPWYIAFYVPPPVQQRYSSNGDADEFRAFRGNSFTTKMLNEDGTEEERDSTGHIPYRKNKSGRQGSSLNQHVVVDNSGINASFDIDLPYTIPSDGKEHLVSVKQYETPATFRYLTIPKADKDAFLEARLINWEDLNLLPGKTNIFYEGTFVGQGQIDPANVKDTMAISLGRDKKIVVKRERDRKLRSVKMIGTNVRETFAYNITVRNTRKEPVTILVQDQLPVSNDKDIVLEDKDSGGADYDETTGALKWMMTLAPNESKKVSFGYTVKYPKGKTLANAN